jgi:hypothetical protein
MQASDIGFVEFLRLVASGSLDEVSRVLEQDASLAMTSSAIGATRQSASDFFIPEIRHCVYSGDTALHVAAAAFRRPVAELLLGRGADCRARNRREAEPLHYAADANHWNPSAQAGVIEYLISSGADANAQDAAGVTPLHRAVRTRSLAAVRALIDGGADPLRRSNAGSTPLHLAVQPTGRGGSGSEEAHLQQAGIIRFLLAHGADPADLDGKGKSVYDAATSRRVRQTLTEITR